MSNVNKPWLWAILLVAAELIYSRIIHPIIISPLRELPNAHTTACISSIWILWHRWKGDENIVIESAHKKHGSVIRLSPTEVSVNCVEGGIRTIYSGGFDKHPWYSYIFNNHGVPNMFSTIHSKPHSARKRLQSHVYSKSYLHSSADFQAISSEILYGRFLPILRRHARTSQPLEILEIFNSTAMDFITAYIFGLHSSTNFLEDEDTRKDWLKRYQSRKNPRFTFWPQELPKLTKWAQRFGYRFVPRWVDVANAKIETWSLEMCDRTEETIKLMDDGEKSSLKPGQNPVVYRALREGLEKQAGVAATESTTQAGVGLRRRVIASELLDQFAAGHETTAFALTFLTYYLSKKTPLQNLLRRELLSLPVDPTSSLPALRDLDKLPCLNAVVMEVLRLRPPIPGPQPRIAPADGCLLGPPDERQYFIPAKTRVSASPYALHRASVWPLADDFRPDRWIDNELAMSAGTTKEEASRWLWTFGSGGRMCIGSNFALMEMKMIIAVMYGAFTTEIVDAEGIEPEQGYMGGPKGNKLVIRLEQAHEGGGLEKADSAVEVESVGS